MTKNLSINQIKARRVLFGVFNILICSVPIIFIAWLISGQGLGIFFQDVRMLIVIPFLIFFVVKGLEHLRLLLGAFRLVDDHFEELLSYYPELGEDLAYLAQADYIDDKMKILVYGEHLIAYHSLDIFKITDYDEITYRFRNANILNRTKIDDISFTEILAYSSGAGEVTLAPYYFKLYNGGEQCWKLLNYIDNHFDVVVSLPGE